MRISMFSPNSRPCFGRDMAAHHGRQCGHHFYLWHDWCILFAFWHSKCLPMCLMGTYQKKRHRNSQYWWRYCHLLLVTAVNSEQDMLHSDRNHLHFLQCNMVDRCMSIWGICSKKCATNILNIKGDIATSCCSSPPTVSTYFLKRQCRSALISFFGNLHQILNFAIHYQFPFLAIWPWKSNGEYLNEINTKHCHTTTVRKPLTRAQTPAQSLGARLTISLCKLEAPEGLANNTRQQTRGLCDESWQRIELWKLWVHQPYRARYPARTWHKVNASMLHTPYLTSDLFFFQEISASLPSPSALIWLLRVSPLSHPSTKSDLNPSRRYLVHGKYAFVRPWGPRHHLDRRDWNGKNLNILDAPRLSPQNIQLQVTIMPDSEANRRAQMSERTDIPGFTCILSATCLAQYQ